MDNPKKLDVQFGELASKHAYLAIACDQDGKANESFQNQVLHVLWTIAALLARSNGI